LTHVTDPPTLTRPLVWASAVVAEHNNRRARTNVRFIDGSRLVEVVEIPDVKAKAYSETRAARKS
jgi:hypothetical protein